MTDEEYEWEERAAIKEFEAHKPRAQAEREATEEAKLLKELRQTIDLTRPRPV